MISRPHLLLPRLALGAALLALTACDSAKPARRSEATPSIFDTPASPATASAPPAIAAQVQVDGPYITALSASRVAKLPFEPSWRYAWTIEGGRILDGGETNEVRYEPGSGGTLILGCRITGPGGASLFASAQQTIVQPPEIQAFDAVPPALLAGGKGHLTWSVRQVARLTLEPGGRDVLKDPMVEISPASATTYRLVATNLAGTSVTRERTVAVLPQPRILAFTWDGSRQMGEPMSLKAEFQDGRAEILEGEAVLGSSSESPLRVTVSPRAATTYTLRVTNETGAATTQTLIVSERTPTP